MTDDQVWKSVTNWVGKSLSSKVVRGWQGQEPPPRPYVMVNLTGVAEVRQHEQEVEYEEDVERVKAAPVIETEWRFSIFSYSETPTDVLRPLRSVEKLAQANEPLYPGLVVHDLSQIRNVPEFQNEDWVPRAQIDLNIRGLVKDGVLIDTIEEHTPAIFVRT